MQTETLSTPANTSTGTKWVIDPLHTEIMFKIKHLVISTVTGSFAKFEGDVNVGGNDFENAVINFKIDVQSIYTGQEHRDAHLRNSDFFDAPTFPEITFQSTSFTKEADDVYALEGNLTLKGVTKPVTLKAEYGGTEKDHSGNTKAGFEVTGTINRKEFGLSYNALTETGGLALGENIKIAANVQLIKQVV